MDKWYVTIDKHCNYPDDPDAAVWTVSRDPNETGWETDSGYNGYGLLKTDAEKLADAANRIEFLELALRQLLDEKCDYMIINHLGDPEKEHTVKLARAALGEKKDD
jgi:hypothetical protein